MCSPAAVARKKSNVFWISSTMISVTCCRIGSLASSLTVPTLCPSFSDSASSKLRSSSFCSESVYWCPPTLTSRVNNGVEPLTMSMFITLAPRFSNATVAFGAGS
jgi:hypothetical protein